MTNKKIFEYIENIMDDLKIGKKESKKNAITNIKKNRGLENEIK